MAVIPPVIKNNPYFDDINTMLSSGRPIKEVVDFLTEKGYPVNRNYLGKYKKEHLDINAKAVDLYLENKAFKEEVDKQVSTLEFYDKIISAGTGVNVNMIDDTKMVDHALKAAKQKEDFLKEHGDKDAEMQTMLLKEIRDELLNSNIKDLLRGISDERTKQRLSQATSDP